MIFRLLKLTTDVILAFESFVALLKFIPDVFILPAIVRFVKAEQLLNILLKTSPFDVLICGMVVNLGQS